MTDEEKSGRSVLKKGEEFLGLYRRVENFTREILQDNEKLRYRVAALEQENKAFSERVGENPRGENLVEKITHLEREKDELLQRYKEVEKENVDFAQRYVEIEAENNNLANLYVASYQLHSTLEFKEVLQIVREIVINLIGSDHFAVFLIDARKGELSAVVAEGMDTENLPVLRAGEGILGKSVTEEQGVYIAGDPTKGSMDPADPIVCIPLRIKSEVIGAIAIYALLEQKKEFTLLDVELFNLLGGHAATAIFGAKLYSESKRKLSTIQGFLELLKPDKGE
jgi:hypothetical protein